MKLIRSIEQDKIKQLSKQCLKQKLYIPGRAGKQLFEQFECIHVLSVLLDKIRFSWRPIGWAHVYTNFAVMAHSNSQLAVYVHPSYRGRKFGEILINKTLDNLYFPIVVDYYSWQYFGQLKSLTEVVKKTTKLSPEDWLVRKTNFDKMERTEETLL